MDQSGNELRQDSSHVKQHAGITTESIKEKKSLSVVLEFTLQ